MSDQTFEQSLMTLREWLDFLDREEARLEAQLQRLRRAAGQAAPQSAEGGEGEEASARLSPSSAPEEVAPPASSFDEEEDDWL